MRIKKSRDRFGRFRSLPLFAGMTEHELTRIDQLLTPVHLDRGKVLTNEGGSGRQAFIILSGTAAVDIAGQLVAIAGPGEVIGEMALIDGRPRTATVTALEDVTAFVLDPREFTTLLQEPGIARRILSTEVNRLRAADSTRAARVPG